MARRGEDIHPRSDVRDIPERRLGRNGLPRFAVRRSDFGQMAANGLNAVRTYTVPPRRVLDLAAEHGLLVMVGIPWEQHVPFLDEQTRARSIEERVRAGVAACAGPRPPVLRGR